MGHRFSASQVEQYALCPRKWAWRKIDGIESTIEKPSASFGKEVHAILEPWLRNAKPIDVTTAAGQVAMSGLHLLPIPMTVGMTVEQPFGLEIGGHFFLGYKDFEILPRVPPLVGDHKTTKDFGWMKTKEELVENIQACVYATDAMIKTNSNECDLQWTYFKTSGPTRTSKVVHLRVTRDQITPTLEKIVRLCNEMEGLIQSGKKSREIPFNPTACEAFGGCEYIDNCNLSPEQRAIAIMSQAKANDFLGKLEGRENGINPPPAIPTPASAPMVGPPAPTWNGQAWVIPPQAQPPVTTSPQMTPSLEGAPPPGPDGRPNYPHSRSSYDPPAPPKPVWNGQNWVIPEVPPTVTEHVPPTPPQPVWNGQAWVIPETTPPATVAVEPKKRGRPKKNTTPAAAAAAAAPEVAQMNPPVAGTEDDDEGEDLRVHMATLLNQAASLIRTCAEMMKDL